MSNSELLDFLVWIQQKHQSKDFAIPIQFIQVLGTYAVEYWEEQDEEES